MKLTNEELARVESVLAAVAPGLPWVGRDAVNDLDETETHVLHKGTHRKNRNANVAVVSAGYDDEATLIVNAPRWLSSLVDEARASRGAAVADDAPVSDCHVEALNVQYIDDDDEEERGPGHLGMALCGGRIHLNIHATSAFATDAGNNAALDADGARTLAAWLTRAADRLERGEPGR